jgi:DME family drug/metabolite transporter
MAGRVCRGGAGALLAASVLWGTTGTAQALAPTDADPTVVGAARLALGGLVLLAACTLLGRARALLALRRGPTARWTLAAAGAAAVFQPAFFAAVDRTGVAVGTLVALGSAPVWCGVLARWWAAEDLPRAWASSTACAVAGCALLVLPGAHAAVHAAGVALAVLAGACYGVYTVSAKRLLAAGGDPLGVLAGTLGLAALLLAPLLAGAPGDLLRPGGLALVAWLGVAATALAYLLFARGLGRVPAATAGTLSLAEPLTAMTLGLLVLGERPSLTAAAGALLLLAGVTHAALAPGRPARATTPAAPVAQAA